MAENRQPRKIPNVQSARRNLFGRDPDQEVDDLARNREDVIQKDETRFAEQWNFNVSTDLPMSGKWRWDQPILLDKPTPLLYVPHQEIKSTGNAGTELLGITDSSQTLPVDIKVSSPTHSLSSGECSQFVAGSSSDDLSSPSTVSRLSNFPIPKPSMKRQRSSSSGEDDANPPHSLPPKR